MAVIGFLPLIVIIFLLLSSETNIVRFMLTGDGYERQRAGFRGGDVLVRRAGELGARGASGTSAGRRRGSGRQRPRHVLGHLRLGQ